jgi:hypothetical protein
MSLALATKGIISGFRVGGDPSIAVPVCEPELTSEEYGEARLSGLEVGEVGPSLYGKDLKPRIKISDID